MLAPARISPTADTLTSIGEVVAAGPPVVVALTSDARVEVSAARGLDPRPGDRGLVITSDDGEQILVALLADPTPRLRPVDEAEARIEADGGASASIERDPRGQQHLLLRDAEARPLFAYEPGSGRCTLYAPEGDLELKAPSGRLTLDGEQGLALRSGAELELTAERLHARALEAEVELTDARVSANALTTTFRRVRQQIDLLETNAGRIVERARESYREVEGLAQTRADHIRQVAARTYRVIGQRTMLKARDDLKLKGEKIHLG